MTKVVELPFGLLAAISTSAVFVPVPGASWMPTGNVTGARSWGELRGRTGAFQCVPAVQVANDTRSPGAVTGIGGTMDADGMEDPATPTAITNSGTSRFMRPGWLVSLTGGGTLAVGCAGGFIEFQFA